MSEYCPPCAKERPKEFEDIREAQAQGCIVFTGLCARHMSEHLKSVGFDSCEEVNGKLEARIGGRVFIGDPLPPSGRSFPEGRAA